MNMHLKFEENGYSIYFYFLIPKNYLIYAATPVVPLKSSPFPRLNIYNNLNK